MIEESAHDDDESGSAYREATPLERDATRLGVLMQLPVLTLADVAELLDMPPSTFRQLRYEGKGPRVIQLGRRVLITRAAFDEWLSKLDKGKGTGD